MGLTTHPAPAYPGAVPGGNLGARVPLEDEFLRYPSMKSIERLGQGTVVWSSFTKTTPQTDLSRSKDREG